MATTGSSTALFKVLDVLDHPHGGKILRLRLQEGDAPSVRVLKKGRLKAVSPGGERRMFRVERFAAFGGKPSDDRLARTGRADLHVYADDDGDGPEIDVGWRVRLVPS